MYIYWCWQAPEPSWQIRNTNYKYNALELKQKNSGILATKADFCGPAVSRLHVIVALSIWQLKFNITPYFQLSATIEKWEDRNSWPTNESITWTISILRSEVLPIVGIKKEYRCWFWHYLFLSDHVYLWLVLRSQFSLSLLKYLR